MSEQKTHPDDKPPGTFEMSLRVLGNEFIGIQIKVDDIKQKWILVSVVAVAALGFTVSEIAPAIVQLFN